MLTDKQLNYLIALDSAIGKCQNCNLYKNGRVRPFWTDQYNGYFIIGECPGQREVDWNEPFIGKAGEILWKSLRQFRIDKDRCLVINSANCRAIKDGNPKKNGKPETSEIIACNIWIKRYLKALQPEAILILGSYALKAVLNENTISVIEDSNKIFTNENIYGMNINVVRSYHPASIIYDAKKKDKLLECFEIYSKL